MIHQKNGILRIEPNEILITPEGPDAKCYEVYKNGIKITDRVKGILLINLPESPNQTTLVLNTGDCGLSDEQRKKGLLCRSMFCEKCKAERMKQQKVK